jgi:hypothetical protein
MEEKDLPVQLPLMDPGSDMPKLKICGPPEADRSIILIMAMVELIVRPCP